MRATLQNGACVKSASQYEWKCIEVKKEGEYCSLPMENKDIRSWSGFQNENGHDWRYDSAHKWCSYSTREDCEKNRCQWYSGGDPRFLGEIPVCADKSAPNDRTKDSKNPDIDCKDTTPVCWSAKEADVTVKLKWENAWQSYLSCMVRIKVEWKSSSYTPIERHFTFRHNWGGEYIANLKEHYPNLKIKKWDVVKIQKVDCSGDKINNKWPQWESREDCKSTGQMRFYPCKIWHTINTSPYTIEVPLGDYRRS